MSGLGKENSDYVSEFMEKFDQRLMHYTDAFKIVYLTDSSISGCLAVELLEEVRRHFINLKCCIHDILIAEEK